MPSQTLIFPVAIAHFGLISSSGSQQRPRTPVLLDNFDVIAKKIRKKEKMKTMLQLQVRIARGDKAKYNEKKKLVKTI